MIRNLLFVACGLLLMLPLPAQTTYTLTLLPTLGGTQSLAGDINATGQVVGTSNGHAVLWSGGSITDLGAGNAYDINATGQTVGYSSNHATLWSGGSTTDLGALSYTYSVATGINSSGVIIGYVSNNSNGSASVAFSYSGGVMTSLGGTVSAAYDINNSGVIAGSSDGRAILWSGGSTIDLGAGTALSVNSSNQAVGQSDTLRATFWNGGSVVDLWHGAAFGINSSGQIVGQEDSGVGLAYLYYGSTAYNLNNLLANPISGWTLSTAIGINDNGQITGFATNTNGDTVAYLLTPVPEPSSYAMITGLLAMVWIGYRRRK